MPLPENLIKILVCPKCKGPLEYSPDENRLTCTECRLRYKIEDNIPVLLVDEAESF